MKTRFALSLIVALSFVTTAYADAFVKLDGIPGESTDATHKDEIQIESYSFGSSSSSSVSASGASAGKAQFSAFTFTHQVDRSSAPLLLAVAKGTAIKTVVLTVRRGSGASPLDYLKVTLTDVLVSSVEVSGNEKEIPLEKVTLRFSKIQFDYSVIGRDGKLAPGTKMGWDVVSNKAL